MARPESGVAATVREFADDVVGGDPGKDEGLMIGVGDKRRRRDAEDMLDKEGDVPKADLDDFVDRMSSMGPLLERACRGTSGASGPDGVDRVLTEESR